jgi:hypothetical protein
MADMGPGLRGCQEILRTNKSVVPAQAGTQKQGTEIPGFPLSRERRAEDARGGSAGLDYSLLRRDDENRGVLPVSNVRFVPLPLRPFWIATPF